MNVFTRWKLESPIFKYHVYQYIVTLGLFIYLAYRNYNIWDILIIGIVITLLMGIVNVRSTAIGMNLMMSKKVMRGIEDEEEREFLHNMSILNKDDELKN